MKLNIPHKTKPYLMAHRGNNVLCPENTLSSFLQAVQDEADIIETDLHLSKDGHFICIHDASVDRTTDGTGKIAEMTLREIKEFNAATYHSTYHKRETIPSLSETIDALPEDIVLALELKPDEFRTLNTAEKLVDCLLNKDMLNRVLILSFDIQHLKAIKQISNEIPVGLISMARLVPPLNVDVFGVFYPFVRINPGIVHASHKRQQLFCPLDTKPDQRLPFYKRLGVDAILSDDPQATRIALNQLYGRE
ncbi:MAG: hypothetical protein K8R40_04100 [Anaerolineaceae bacterium]|nr:hypothetical protein [Anaerolineaceae bacterium]